MGSEPNEALHRVLTSLAGIAETAAAFAASPKAQSIVQNLTDMSEKVKHIYIGAAQALEANRPALTAMADRIRAYNRLEQTGWLPHSTTPGEILTGGLTDGDIDRLIGEFYRDHWSDITNEFQRQLSGLQVDAAAKEVFVDALRLHEQGHYRAVCRLLFPEIERLSRAELHGGSFSNITSQHDLIEQAGNMGLDQVEPGGLYTFRLYEKLAEHVYAKADTPEKVAKLSLDPVPNRHAAIHGIIDYHTEQNSINTLILTQYVYQVISAVKAASTP